MSNNTQSQENYPCPGLGNNTAVQSMFISLDLDVIGYVLRIIKDRDVFQALACKRFYDALVSTATEGVPCIRTVVNISYKFIELFNHASLEVVLTCLKDKNYYNSNSVRNRRCGESDVEFACRQDKLEMSLFAFACRNDKQGACLKMLIKYGAQDSKISTSAVNAIAHNNPVGLQILIDNGLQINFYNPNNFMANPLNYSITCGSVECVEVLIANGADTKRKYGTKTPFHSLSMTVLAPQNSVDSIIGMLVSSGSDINSTDMYGICPLKHSMTSDRNIGIVKALVNANADINRTKGSEYYGAATPLVCALDRRCCDDIAIFLIEAGANLDYYEPRLGSAIFCAIAEENTKIVKCLLKHHVSIESRNSDGMTSLMVACELTDSSIAHLLIEHGADLEAKNQETSLCVRNIATLRGHYDIVDLIDLKRSLVTPCESHVTPCETTCEWDY
jgi:ankyrin repeat protein